MTGGIIRTARAFAASRRGVALTELALSLPFFLGVGLAGVEVANYAIVNMKVSQLAIQLADNASRIGDTSTLNDRKIYESDINDLLQGASIQGGKGLDFYDHGRAIVSSLEVYPGTTDRQYIHWQRCMGKKEWSSSYGVAGDGTDGELTGMGPEGEEVVAFAGEAVIFVEVAYDYQPLISSRLIGNSTIRAISSFTVRADRDLSQIHQRSPASPAATCSRFANDFA